MQLIKLCVIVYVYSTCVIAEEVCVHEAFNAPCAADQVVFIETAFYGRRNNSRCFNVTDNETACMVDLRLDIQKELMSKPNNSYFKLAHEFFTRRNPCVNGLPPFLDITHRCTKLIRKDICVWETFNAECSHGNVIFIQSALYGRMRNSRCIANENTGLSCYANVGNYFEKQCNGRSQCRVLATDPHVIQAETSCNKYQKPYLEVDYTCVHEFSCPAFTVPDGTSLSRTSDGYKVLCPNETVAKNVHCVGKRWSIDPKSVCHTKGADWFTTVMFSVPAAVLLVSIISVAILLNRMQKKALRGKAGAEEDYADYPESHLRRNGAACSSDNDDYGEIDDCEYGAYSEVRCTGP